MYRVRITNLQKQIREQEAARTSARFELASLEREVMDAFKDNSLDSAGRKQLMKIKRDINRSVLAGIEQDTQLWNMRRRLKNI